MRLRSENAQAKPVFNLNQYLDGLFEFWAPGAAGWLLEKAPKRKSWYPFQR
jgi:hypothetical protein